MGFLRVCLRPFCSTGRNQCRHGSIPSPMEAVCPATSLPEKHGGEAKAVESADPSYALRRRYATSDEEHQTTGKPLAAPTPTSRSGKISLITYRLSRSLRILLLILAAFVSFRFFFKLFQFRFRMYSGCPERIKTKLMRWPLLSRDFTELNSLQSETSKVAVCLIGGLRTFKHQDIRESLKAFVVKNNGIIFMELIGEGEEQNEWRQIFTEEFPSAQIRWHGNRSCLEPELQQHSDCCQNANTEEKLSNFVQYLWTSMCVRRALEYEKAAGASFSGFSWFVRTRPDVLFLESFDVRQFDPSAAVVIRRGHEYENTNWGDWFMASARENAIWFYDSLVDAHESKCAVGRIREVQLAANGPEFRWREHIERCSAFEWVRGDRFHFEAARAVTGLPSQPTKRIMIEIQSLPAVISRVAYTVDEDPGRYCVTYEPLCSRIKGVQPDDWYRLCVRMTEIGKIPDCTNTNSILRSKNTVER